MAKAGYCSKCGANVWLYDNGTCPAGHGADCISNVYEADPAAVVQEPLASGIVAEPPTEPSVPAEVAEETPLVKPLAPPDPSTRVPEATPVQAAIPAIPEETEVAPASTPAEKPKRSKKGVLIAFGVLAVLLVCGGLSVGAFMLLGGNTNDSAIEAAADYQAAIYEGRWDDAMSMASDSEAQDMQEFLDNQDPDDPIVYAEVVDRYWRDDQLVLDTEREDQNGDPVIFRYYFLQEDTDLDTITVLFEVEREKGDPDPVFGFYIEMYEDDSEWKVLNTRGMLPDEMDEYDFFD